MKSEDIKEQLKRLSTGPKAISGFRKSFLYSAYRKGYIITKFNEQNKAVVVLTGCGAEFLGGKCES